MALALLLAEAVTLAHRELRYPVASERKEVFYVMHVHRAAKEQMAGYVNARRSAGNGRCAATVGFGVDRRHSIEGDAAAPGRWTWHNCG